MQMLLFLLSSTSYCQALIRPPLYSISRATGQNSQIRVYVPDISPSSRAILAISEFNTLYYNDFYVEATRVGANF
jgi:hypothetical protein